MMPLTLLLVSAGSAAAYFVMCYLFGMIAGLANTPGLLALAARNAALVLELPQHLLRSPRIQRRGCGVSRY